MITDNPTEHTGVMVMFRILTRRDWDNLQSWHASHPGSSVEHLHCGLFVLTVPAGAAREAA